MTDPIADMLSRIKNGYLAKSDLVEIPYAQNLAAIAHLLSQEGYIQKNETKEENGRKKIIIALKYEGKKPALTNFQRVSKPGLRIYVRKNNIPRVLGGIGKVLISTPQGLMTDEEAKKKGQGGEIICKLW